MIHIVCSKKACDSAGFVPARINKGGCMIFAPVVYGGGQTC
ncbi:hypothetical protein MPF_1042 [Methanohalophilus portucalensis FDF-1]|uniref:Uncharacterized protein n=1 Tax=Methanohalophilus portucalensis FDF-1 TaxID=523843 RepID=A0A1L9C3Q4_9EURY|nr:hypothetical protein MPF_1042 [Methanohalophilus portucalensis FDF-1]